MVLLVLSSPSQSVIKIVINIVIAAALFGYTLHAIRVRTEAETVHDDFLQWYHEVYLQDAGKAD